MKNKKNKKILINLYFNSIFNLILIFNINYKKILKIVKIKN